ncbi:MAG: hypothetical protein ACU0DI_13610 [Paracoccaceae bacterium]
MVGPSKILTVSYGTFSCTLEGFDNPFGTMRGIAEYFRDLAAEDRYFGAEPPTPDADVLHRIAQSEVKQRIEARVEGDGVVLRQLNEAAAPDESATVEPAPITAPVDAEPPLDPPPPPSGFSAYVVPVPEPAPAAPVGEFAPYPDAAPAGTESVAAKLARIRAVVADDTGSDVSAYQEDAPVDNVFAAMPISSAFEDAAEAEDIQTPSEATETIAEAAAKDQPEPEEETPLVEAEEHVTNAQESVVAQPVVAESETDDETAVEAVAEDQVATDQVETEESSVEAPLETMDEIKTASDDEIKTEIDEEVSSEIVAQVDDADDVAADHDQEETSADADVSEDAVSQFMGAASDAETEIDEDLPTDIDEDLPTEVAAQADDQDDQDDGAEVLDQEETSADADVSEDAVSQFMGTASDVETEIDEASEAEATDAPDGSAIARVVEMRQSENEISRPGDSIDAAKNAVGTLKAENARDEPVSTLSEEDEAELMANLDQLQRQADADRRAEKEGRTLLEQHDIESSANSVKRILDVTNTELEESEGTRRRSAIAHLKAAVAATRADEFLTKQRDEDDAKELDRYRNDLARVVRPRRPSESSGKPTERKMAPLMLVSEQRVDIPKMDPIAEAAAAAIRPRRVTSGNLALSEDDLAEDDSEANIFRDGGSFAEFAEEMGARELPDLLEAAAAYASFVEGRPHFSRPHLMKTVATLKEQQEFTREEGLRSFGILLRRGKIKKIKRGQFQISDKTRFNPETRIAGE